MSKLREAVPGQGEHAQSSAPHGVRRERESAGRRAQGEVRAGEERAKRGFAGSLFKQGKGNQSHQKS